MKTYKPNAKALFIMFSIMALFMPAVMLFYPPYESNEIYGSLGFSLMFILLGIVTYSVRVVITDDSKLKYSFLFFYKKEVDVADIYKIKRMTNFRGSGAAGGYQMVVHYKDDGNKLFVINENAFEKKVIAKFITEIQKINSNIELSRYYQTINDKPGSSHFSDFSKKQKIGLFGAVVSMIIFLATVDMQSLLSPVIILSTIFFFALFITDRIKKAIISILTIIAFFGAIMLFTLIK